MYERAILADALPRSNIRKERRANGGGIGPALKKTATSVMNTILPFVKAAVKAETGVDLDMDAWDTENNNNRK
jgi:hypothetical protein